MFYDVLIGELWSLGRDCPSQVQLIPRHSKQLVSEPTFHAQTNPL